MNAKPDHKAGRQGRTLPNDPAAERGLLGSIIADDDPHKATLDEAIAAGVTAKSFADHDHARVFGVMQQMRREGLPVEDWTLVEHLTKTGMEQARAIAVIGDVTASAPTSAYFKPRLADVLEAERRRQIITAATAAAEAAFNGEPAADVAQNLKAAIERPLMAATPPPAARTLMSLTATADERRSANLLGNGFLRRGQGALMPGATGIGKSSLAMQKAILWALGKAAFGVNPQGPLTSLLVQAENDDIDLVEMRDGVCDGLNLDATEREIVARRVFVLTAHERGAQLMARLESEAKRIKPDLLWLDPLFAFMEGGVKDQEAASIFLRTLLQPFIVRHSLGVIILHHTNKPPSGKEKSTWQSGDFAYAGSGSIEFANWARAVVFLRSIGKPDVFELMLPKRGKRAGITDTNGAPVTSVLIRHAKKPGTIFWELADSSDRITESPNSRTPQLLRAFHALDKGQGVSLMKMAQRLKVSGKTVRRDLKGGVHTDDGDALVVRDNMVFAEEI